MVNEELNRDEKAIADMLGGLPRLKVPNDFDFRVKARIAEGRPAANGFSRLVLSLRFAIPLILLLAVGGYLAFRSFGASVADVSIAGEMRSSNNVAETVSTPDLRQPAKDVRAEIEPVKPKDTAPQVASVISDPVIAFPIAVNRGGGSVERGLGTTRPIYPRGVDPNAKTPVVPKEFDQLGNVTAKDLMNLLGLDVIYSESSWKVESVRENSTAQRAGLKSGDVVEAINERPISEKTTFKGRFTSKSMRLIRDGKSVDIDLQNPN